MNKMNYISDRIAKNENPVNNNDNRKADSKSDEVKKTTAQKLLKANLDHHTNSGTKQTSIL